MDALAVAGEGEYTTLDASGLAVGIPAGVMGNSEVGHFTIGTGRVIYQVRGTRTPFLPPPTDMCACSPVRQGLLYRVLVGEFPLVCLLCGALPTLTHTTCTIACKQEKVYDRGCCLNQVRSDR